MIIKSLCKDLMDTLPVDLLKLIDGHISYVEETLLLYSSNYSGPMKKVHTWKNFLHHLYRRYDEYDTLFIDTYVERYIIKNYAIPNNDLVACIHLSSAKVFGKKHKHYSFFEIARSAIKQHQDDRIIKYLLQIINDQSTFHELFYDACRVYNKRICCFLVDKIGLESIISKANSPFDGLTLFRFYTMNPENRTLLRFIVNKFRPNYIVRFISKVLKDNQDKVWIFSVADQLPDIRIDILYRLISKKLIEVAKIFSTKYQLGGDAEILSGYVLKKSRSIKAKYLPDILKVYYDLKLIDLTQLGILYQQMLTMPRIRFLTIDSYILLSNTISLDINVLNKVFDESILAGNSELIKYMIVNQQFTPNKYQFTNLLDFDLDVETMALLLEKKVVSGDDIFANCIAPEYFMVVSKLYHLNEMQLEKSIGTLISNLNVGKEFIDHITNKYPTINYQNLIEKTIINLETKDEYKFVSILKFFETSSIRLNYERLLNIARQKRHVDVAIFLHDVIKNDH